jgi:hypothetical protein
VEQQHRAQRVQRVQQPSSPAGLRSEAKGESGEASPSPPHLPTSPHPRSSLSASAILPFVFLAPPSVKQRSSLCPAWPNCPGVPYKVPCKHGILALFAGVRSLSTVTQGATPLSPRGLSCLCQSHTIHTLPSHTAQGPGDSLAHFKSNHGSPNCVSASAEVGHGDEGPTSGKCRLARGL